MENTENKLIGLLQSIKVMRILVKKSRLSQIDYTRQNSTHTEKK